KDQIPLYTVFTIDETTLPLQKDLALGVPGAQEWVNDLPVAANVEFVAGYRAKYHRSPSFYGAQAYDAAGLDQQRCGVRRRRSDQEGRHARRHAQGQLRLRTRALPLRQQPFPDREFLPAGDHQAARWQLRSKNGCDDSQRQSGFVPRQMPDEVVGRPRVLTA